MSNKNVIDEIVRKERSFFEAKRTVLFEFSLFCNLTFSLSFDPNTATALVLRKNKRNGFETVSGQPNK
jgi:hypothetical protein